MAEHEHDNPEQSPDEQSADGAESQPEPAGSAEDEDNTSADEPVAEGAEAASTGAGAAGDATEQDDSAVAEGAGAQAEASLDDAQHAAEELAAETGDAPKGVNLPNFERAVSDGDDQSAALGLLDDVDLHVKIELGRTRMYVEDVLRLNDNSVVELDKAAGDPVDVFVNGQHVARGEVLVVNENFCIRISEIIQDVEPEDALRGSTN